MILSIKSSPYYSSYHLKVQNYIPILHLDCKPLYELSMFFICRLMRILQNSLSTSLQTLAEISVMLQMGKKKEIPHLFSFVLPESITKTTSGIVMPVSAIFVAKTIWNKIAKIKELRKVSFHLWNQYFENIVSFLPRVIYLNNLTQHWNYASWKIIQFSPVNEK